MLTLIGSLAEAELHLQSADDAAFSVLKHQHAHVLGGAPQDMQQVRDMELELEMGNAPMPRPSSVKRLLEGELA